MVVCENCKTEIKKKKEKKIETEEEINVMPLLMITGAGVGGYLLWKQYKQPTTSIKQPIPIRSSSPTKEEIANNLMRVNN